MILGRLVITGRHNSRYYEHRLGSRWRAFWRALKELNPLPTVYWRRDMSMEADMLAKLEAAIRRNPKAFARRWLHRRNPLP